ncbi:MAG: glycosyltransferase [Litorilinea sp.]
MIATVYNERHTIDGLLDSLRAQTRRPDEVVFCDGGSTDGTADYLREWLGAWEDAPAFKILVEVGANISRGRNLAIGAADGPIIAVTDAGVRLDPQWLEALGQPWEAATDLDDVPAVAGFFVPDLDTRAPNLAFATAMAATVLPLEDDIDPQRFLPSSRSVAFLKQTWRGAGEYPEWLDYCEDLIFDLRVNANGLHPAGDDQTSRQTSRQTSQFVWQPRARVHFRPRGDLGAFWRQYYLYARGDGKADLWRKRHALRYLVYAVIAPALLGHALGGRWGREWGWLGLAAGFAAYMTRPWQRVVHLGTALSIAEMAAALLWVPVIRIVGDLAKMAGYPVGMWWRWQNRQRPEIRWRQETTRSHDPAD